MSVLLEKKAKAVSDRLKSNLNAKGVKAIDWQKWIEVFLQFLPVVLAFCQKSSSNEEIAARMKSPGLFERAVFRRRLREELNKENDAVRRELRRHLDDVCDACIEEAAVTKVADLEVVVEEATQYEGFPI